jgi:hypothetical protein
MTASAKDASHTAAAAKPATTKPRAPAKAARKIAVKPASAQPAVAAKADKAAAAVSTKPAAKAETKPAPAKAAEAKPAKVKLVRDSFTMPLDEYAVLAVLKQRALSGAHPVKKSELLRAGIKQLAALSDAALLRALKSVPSIKTGRPKSKKGD